MNIFDKSSHGKDNLFDLVPEIGEQMGCLDSVIDHQFPHIAEIILSLWGSSECMDYLDELLNYVPDVQRPHGRQGFPFPAMRELTIIQQYHVSEFPNLDSQWKRRSDNPWK